jgi:hypothetical protein
VLRAVQLQPSLAAHWRGSLWFQLLHHQLPLVRWAAVRAVSQMLCCADAVSSRLMDAHLDSQQQVEAAARWVLCRGGVLWGARTVCSAGGRSSVPSGAAGLWSCCLQQCVTVEHNGSRQRRVCLCVWGGGC